MSTLVEIERAADVLPVGEKRQLVLFLLTRLHSQTNAPLPPVRDLPRETIENWIADDEAGYREFLGGN